jgi:hypothetical protein
MTEVIFKNRYSETGSYRDEDKVLRMYSDGRVIADTEEKIAFFRKYPLSWVEEESKNTKKVEKK